MPARNLPPPPKSDSDRFDDWMTRLYQQVTGGVGYGPGLGGAVTQQTNKATGVTLNTLSGKITMNNANLAGPGTVSFVVTNSLVDATDSVMVNVASGGTVGGYAVVVSAVSAGSFTVSVINVSGGALAEAIVLNFNVIKGVSA